MDRLLNMLLATGPHKLTSFTRWWLMLDLIVSTPFAIAAISAQTAGNDVSWLGYILAFPILFPVYLGVMMFFAAIPVLVVAAIAFVVFGGLTK